MHVQLVLFIKMVVCNEFKHGKHVVCICNVLHTTKYVFYMYI